MICPNCGAPLPDTATMCYSCKYHFTHTRSEPVEQTKNEYSSYFEMLPIQETPATPQITPSAKQCPNCFKNVPCEESVCSLCGFNFIEAISHGVKIKPIYLTQGASEVMPQSTDQPKNKKTLSEFLFGSPQQKVDEPQSDNSVSELFRPMQLRCRRCGGTNIQVNYNRYQVSIKGKSEVKKKSYARRKVEKKGRHAANLLTMGAYGMLTKKPSDYVEVSKDKFKNKKEKVAVCQSCGFSWKV